MTRSNRRVCREWSKLAPGKEGGNCFECESTLVHKSGEIYVCEKCGLEQKIRIKGERY